MSTLLWLFICGAALAFVWIIMAVGSALRLMEQVPPNPTWAERSQLGATVQIFTKRLYWTLGLLVATYLAASFKSPDFGSGVIAAGLLLFLLFVEAWVRLVLSCFRIVKDYGGVGVWPLTRAPTRVQQVIPTWLRRQTPSEIVGLLGSLGVLCAVLYLFGLLEFSHWLRELQYYAASSSSP